MDQFVPICSIEVNSSPVSPGYWPSQQEPPANPYTESEWERGREEGGLSGNERERQAISEKWASAEKKTWNAMKERWWERSRWRREMRKVEEWDRRGSQSGRRGKKGGWRRGTGASRSFLCSTKLELKEWSRSNRHASEPASELAPKQRQWYTDKF